MTLWVWLGVSCVFEGGIKVLVVEGETTLLLFVYFKHVGMYVNFKFKFKLYFT